MRLARELTTRLVDAGGDVRTPTSEILVEGQPTDKFLPGAHLEAAVHWTKFYLLFTTNDVPFEESLRISLLDEQFAPLDQAVIGGLYATGSFSALKLVDPDVVRFQFMGDATWSVRLLSRRAFRMPFFSEPGGVYRPFGFSRQFVVSKQPISEGG